VEDIEAQTVGEYSPTAKNPYLSFAGMIDDRTRKYYKATDLAEIIHAVALVNPQPIPYPTYPAYPKFIKLWLAVDTTSSERHPAQVEVTCKVAVSVKHHPVEWSLYHAVISSDVPYPTCPYAIRKGDVFYINHDRVFAVW
jgi:hypothetical protein